MVKQYMKLVRICMKENYFTALRAEYYKQLKAALMGKPLFNSSAKFSWPTCKESNFLPVLCHVDDVCPTIGKEKVKNTLNILNSIESNIGSTLEIENEPFIDLLFRRKPGDLQESDRYQTSQLQHLRS